MRGFIQNKLVTVSTIKLTAISVATSVAITILLTGVVSFLIMGRLSVELLFANSLIGMIVPLIVAPFAINLLKQATNYEEINRELSRENIERKRLEKEAEQKARDMQAVNELAIECAAATPDTDIFKLIAEKLRDITNAVGVGVTVYDPASRSLTTKHIAVSGQVLSVANQLIGFNLIGMVSPVTPEIEEHMLTDVVESFSDLSGVSFGLIPKPVAAMIKNTLGVGNVIALALSYSGKLIGTAIIAQREGHPAIDIEVYRTLAHVSAVSIQRKDTEDALRENEIKFRTLIENLSEGILLLDEHGTVIEWNPSQESITDMSREDVIGKPIWDIQFQLMPENRRTPGFYEKMKEKSIKILSSGDFTNFNHTIAGPIQSAKGNIRHILQTSFPVLTQNRFRVGSIMRDISSQIQAETDRNNLIAELKSKNTELEQFTYTVSHDLKAPLITIKGFLGLLEKDALNGNIELMKKDISRIAHASDKMQRLLNELLELSRIGRIVNPSLEVPFERIVQDAMASVHGRLGARGVKVNVMENLPVVFVDQTRVNQVVQNLLDNAAKFMGDQTDPNIEIGTQGIDKDGKPILYIRDNGIGIESHQLETAFGLFQKLDISAEGTGVGLALVKRIIEVHGGRVWIASDGRGQGTTVFFTLPVLC